MRTPDNIKAIWDNEGQTFDRYSVVLKGPWSSGGRQNECLGLSHNPDSPLGFSQFCGAESGPHLGVKIKFSNLPKNIQSHIIGRL